MNQVKSKYNPMRLAIINEIVETAESNGDELTVNEVEIIANTIINNDYIWEQLNSFVVECIDEIKGE